jgi:hypothetical protein
MNHTEARDLREDPTHERRRDEHQQGRGDRAHDAGGHAELVEHGEERRGDPQREQHPEHDAREARDGDDGPATPAGDRGEHGDDEDDDVDGGAHPLILSRVTGRDLSAAPPRGA